MILLKSPAVAGSHPTQTSNRVAAGREHHHFRTVGRDREPAAQISPPSQAAGPQPPPRVRPACTLSVR